MRNNERVNRRSLVVAAGIVGLDVILTGPALYGSSASSRENSEQERPVTPAEDLMFEHGVLERLLLIYAEIVRRVESGGEFPATLIFDTASLFRSFGEDYHERLEEQYIFPALEKTSQHAGLAKALKRQHDVGRTITTSLLNMTRTGSLMQPQQAAEALRSFHRMYLPHISRENSVAFRAFHSLVPHERYMDLGEQFEVKEHAQFGEDGFDRIVAQVPLWSESWISTIWSTSHPELSTHDRNDRILRLGITAKVRGPCRRPLSNNARDTAEHGGLWKPAGGQGAGGRVPPAVQSSPAAQFAELRDAGGVRRRLFGFGCGFGGACAYAKQERNRQLSTMNWHMIRG